MILCVLVDPDATIIIPTLPSAEATADEDTGSDSTITGLLMESTSNPHIAGEPTTAHSSEYSR